MRADFFTGRDQSQVFETKLIVNGKFAGARSKAVFMRDCAIGEGGLEQRYEIDFTVADVPVRIDRLTIDTASGEVAAARESSTGDVDRA